MFDEQHKLHSALAIDFGLPLFHFFVQVTKAKPHFTHAEYRSHEELYKNLKKDADQQRAIMAKKRSVRSDDTEAASMSPHLSRHATRGQEAGKGGSVHSSSRTQQSIHGTLQLPPDEATPFFDTYVLRYAFPTIAVICT